MLLLPQIGSLRLSFIAAILGLIAFGYAQDSTDRAINPKQIIEELDSDKDGKISRAEFASGRRASRLQKQQQFRLFERFDRDRDQFISYEELQYFRRNHDPIAFLNLITKMDQDENGTITRREFDAHPQFAKMELGRRNRIFWRLDRNADGVLDTRDAPRRYRENALTNHPEKPKLAPIGGTFDKLDTDRDGFLNFPEFQFSQRAQGVNEVRQLRRFRRVDRNGDGKVSFSEMSSPTGKKKGSKKSKSKQPENKNEPKEEAEEKQKAPTAEKTQTKE